MWKIGTAAALLLLAAASAAGAQGRACKDLRGVRECATDFGRHSRTEWSAKGIVTEIEVVIRDGSWDNAADQAAALTPVVDMLSPRPMNAREVAVWINRVVEKMRSPGGERLRLGDYEWRPRIDAQGELVVSARYMPQHR